MDCTQQLDGEQPAPRQQIYAFLHIPGSTCPIKLGPNLIGRDPSKCQIVIDMASISRLHAMINVLSTEEFMIMDLNSANNTKIGVKTLLPYCLWPLKDGDMVQFGNVICMFRLCNDLLENELPMTQVLDMPETLALRDIPVSVVSDTPVRPAIKHVKQMTVPESPECSDVDGVMQPLCVPNCAIDSGEDESFIMPSQPVLDHKIKSNPKIMIAAITKSPATNKENHNDSLFWKASSRSPSIKLQLDDSSSSLNDSRSGNHNGPIADIHSQNVQKEHIQTNIHKIDTQSQQPLMLSSSPEDCSQPESRLHNVDTRNIDMQETQLPYGSPKVADINNMDTQDPVQFQSVIEEGNQVTLSMPNHNFKHPQVRDIHFLETQLPESPKTVDMNEMDTQMPEEFQNVTENKQEYDDIVKETQIKNIYFMKTQLPYSPNSAGIHNMETQVPDGMQIDLQEVTVDTGKITIHKNSNKQETQLFPKAEHNNTDRQVESQKNAGLQEKAFKIMNHLNSSTGKNFEDQIQIITVNTEIPTDDDNKDNKSNKDTSNNDGLNFSNKTNHDVTIKETTDDKENKSEQGKDLSESDEEILFEEFETQGFNVTDSQPLLHNTEVREASPEIPPANTIKLSNVVKTKINTDKPTRDNDSDCSTDCEDLFDLLPEKYINKSTNDDDLTDCEEEMRNNPRENKTTTVIADMNITGTCSNYNEMDTPVLPVSKTGNFQKYETSNQKLVSGTNVSNKANAASTEEEQKEAIENYDIRNAPTQIIVVTSIKKELPAQVIVKDTEDISDAPTQVIAEGIYDISDAPTQIIVVTSIEKELPAQVIVKDTEDISDAPTQVEEMDDICDVTAQIIVTDDRIISPFKIPPNVGFKGKKSNVARKLISPNSSNVTSPVIADLTKPMELCSSLNIDKNKEKPSITESSNKQSIERNIEKLYVSPNKTPTYYYDNTQAILADLQSQNDEFVPSSQEDYQVGEKFPHITKHLPSVIKQASGPSDGEDTNNYNGEDVKYKGNSDCEQTPKKNPIVFPDSLPDSQEIKSLTQARVVTPNTPTELSDSEQTEENSESQGTPIVFRKKSRKIKKNNAKLDLMARLEADSLPTRILTRVRKPTPKFQTNEKLSNIVAKSNWAEEEVDEEIIRDNIAKLKEGKCKAAQKEAAPMESASKNHCSVEKNESANKNDKPLKRTREKTKNITNNNKEKDTKESKTNATESLTQDVSKNEENVKGQSNKTTKKACIKNNKIMNEKNSNDESNYHKRSSTRNKKKYDKAEKPIVVLNSDSENELPFKKPKHAKVEKSKDLCKEGGDSSDQSVLRSTRQKMENSQIDTTKKSIEFVKSSAEKSVTSSKAAKAKKDSVPKNALEHSRVYSLIEKSDLSSNESNSPALGRSSRQRNSRKRLAEEPVMSPKIAKSTISSDLTVSSVRSTPTRASVKHKKVLFTAYGEDSKPKDMLDKLGAKLVNDAATCSVVVTRNIKRTFKLLCAIGLGKPIVGPSWLEACRTTNVIVEPRLYLLKDKAAEKRFNFCLERTLNGPRNFLAGYNISSTPSVMPGPTEMKLIVECSGGKWKEGGKSWLCVSLHLDKSYWCKLKKRGATIVSSELILSGVLRQQLDVQAYKLA